MPLMKKKNRVMDVPADEVDNFLANGYKMYPAEHVGIREEPENRPKGRRVKSERDNTVDRQAVTGNS